jgi:hypothetical protein
VDLRGSVRAIAKRYIPAFTEVTEENYEKVSQFSLWPSRDSNLTPPKYKSKALEQAGSVIIQM